MKIILQQFSNSQSISNNYGSQAASVPSFKSGESDSFESSKFNSERFAAILESSLVPKEKAAALYVDLSNYTLGTSAKSKLTTIKEIIHRKINPDNPKNIAVYSEKFFRGLGTIIGNLSPKEIRIINTYTN